jgi:hypothetical protein
MLLPQRARLNGGIHNFEQAVAVTAVHLETKNYFPRQTCSENAKEPE